MRIVYKWIRVVFWKMNWENRFFWKQDSNGKMNMKHNFLLKYCIMDKRTSRKSKSASSKKVSRKSRRRLHLKTRKNGGGP